MQRGHPRPSIFHRVVEPVFSEVDMRRTAFFLVGIVVVALSAPNALARVPVSLGGSPASMLRQHGVAELQDLTFARTPEEVQALVKEGKLIPLKGNAHYTVLPGVQFPYAQPEVRLFIERLAEQYHKGTGEKLVVTSLTRPVSMQPNNSHRLSVHPAGMAVDLRVSKKAKSRAWLENVLLKLEKQELLDITRERYPPHYHVAIFPEAYRAHVEELIGPQAVALALTFPEPEPEPEKVVRSATQRESHVVAAAVTEGSHENLWRQFALGFVLIAGVLGGLNHRQIRHWIAKQR